MLFSVAVVMSVLALVFLSNGVSTESWSSATTVLSIVSVVASALLAILLFIINRKNAAEEKLRISELARLHEYIDQVKEDVAAVRRDDIKEIKIKLEALGSTVLLHQNSCIEKFILRTSYSEDLRAHRESLALLRDTMRQQAEVIERLRD